jgi:hypothetical protein
VCARAALGTLFAFGRAMRAAIGAIMLVGCSSASSAPDADAASPGDTDATAQDARASDVSPADAGGACDASDSTYTCSTDGNAREKCTGGSLVSETCPRGCLREPAGTDAVCMGTTDPWSCTGSYGTKKAQDGDYYITAFGCYIDGNGVEQTDPGDNCVPTCLAQARAAGVCMQGDTGKQCEERVNWYTADGARFGCLARLRITNPANGKSVVAVALDFGPACSVESRVSKAVLDTSGRIDDYLFGGPKGASDRSLVHVVEVDGTTPLGP